MDGGGKVCAWFRRLKWGNRTCATLACCKRRQKGTKRSHSYRHVSSTYSYQCISFDCYSPYKLCFDMFPRRYVTCAVFQCRNSHHIPKKHFFAQFRGFYCALTRYGSYSANNIRFFGSKPMSSYKRLNCVWGYTSLHHNTYELWKGSEYFEAFKVPESKGILKIIKHSR